MQNIDVYVAFHQADALIRAAGPLTIGDIWNLFSSCYGHLVMSRPEVSTLLHQCLARQMPLQAINWQLKSCVQRLVCQVVMPLAWSDRQSPTPSISRQPYSAPYAQPWPLGTTPTRPPHPTYPPPFTL